MAKRIVRRRPTRRVMPSERYIRRIAKLQDRRELQKAEGKWYGFREEVSVTTSSGEEAYTNLVLPRPLTTKVTSANKLTDRGIEIYGMNSIIILSTEVTDSQSVGTPVIGALAATILRWDESLNNVANPFPITQPASGPGVAEDPAMYWNIRPWRWWQPFFVSLAAEDPKHIMAMPFAFRRGTRIKLEPANYGSPGDPEDRYVLYLGLAPKSPSTKVTLQWFGRYRFIEKAVN